MSCESCTDEARERMKDLDNFRDKAKKYAKEIKAPVAVCKEPAGAYHLAPAIEAINNGFIITEIVSDL